jgi:hypothetical protein
VSDTPRSDEQIQQERLERRRDRRRQKLGNAATPNRRPGRSGSQRVAEFAPSEAEAEHGIAWTAPTNPLHIVHPKQVKREQR